MKHWSRGAVCIFLCHIRAKCDEKKTLQRIMGRIKQVVHIGVEGSWSWPHCDGIPRLHKDMLTRVSGADKKVVGRGGIPPYFGVSKTLTTFPLLCPAFLEKEHSPNPDCIGKPNDAFLG